MHMRRFVSLAAIAVLAALGALGCSEPTATPEPPVPPMLGPPDTLALAVRTVDWNPSRLDLGAVAVVLEREADQVVLSDRGAYVVAGGALVQSDTRIAGYTAGAIVPAGDSAGGEWVLGVDGHGAVQHLRSSGLMEPVSDRYGLTGVPVRALGRLGNNTVFQLDAQLAVADGAQIVRHDVGALTQLTMGGARVAGVTAEGRVRVVTLPGAATVDYTLAATGLALRADGKLVVSTRDALYVENAAAELVLTFAPRGATLGAVAAVGDRAWFLVGGDIATLDADGTVRRTVGQTFPPGARLRTARDGVWLHDGAAALRVGPDDALAAKLRRWEDTVRPIFLRACARCHLPGGVGRINLSGYPAWLEFRDELVEQVVDLQRMPPPGNALSEADRASLGAWLNDPAR